MEFIKANEQDLDLVYDIVSSSIHSSVLKGYNQEIVDFFLIIHSRDRILSDILNNDLWILKDKGEYVGTGFANANHISLVYLRPEFQNMGYGTKIMDYLEAIVEKNYDSVILDPTKYAIPFYEKRGYRLISHEDTYLKNGTYLAHDIMEKHFR